MQRFLGTAEPFGTEISDQSETPPARTWSFEPFVLINFSDFHAKPVYLVYTESFKFTGSAFDH